MANAHDLAHARRRRARRTPGRLAPRAVQPALPARHRPAGQLGPPRAGAPGRRTDADRAARARDPRGRGAYVAPTARSTRRPEPSWPPRTPSVRSAPRPGPRPPRRRRGRGRPARRTTTTSWTTTNSTKKRKRPDGRREPREPRDGRGGEGGRCRRGEGARGHRGRGRSRAAGRRDRGHRAGEGDQRHEVDEGGGRRDGGHRAGQPPQGPRGHRRLGRHGPRPWSSRSSSACAPPLRQDRAAHQEALRPRRRGRPPRSATGSGCRRPARCPSSSAGA